MNDEIDNISAITINWNLNNLNATVNLNGLKVPIFCIIQAFPSAFLVPVGPIFIVDIALVVQIVFMNRQQICR